METGIVLEGSVQAETVTVDTAAEAETTIMAAGSDITKVIHMMIHAANEGISLLGYGIGLLGGSLFALRLSLQHSRVSGVHKTYHTSVFYHQDPGKEHLSGRYPISGTPSSASRLRTFHLGSSILRFCSVCEVTSKFALFPQAGTESGGSTWKPLDALVTSYFVFSLVLVSIHVRWLLDKSPRLGKVR